MKCIGSVFVAFLMLGVAANAITLDLYSDTLTYADGGINATTDWNNDNTWISWEIFEIETGIWSFTYEWNTTGRDLSHIIIEVTDDAPEEDFWDWEFGADIEANSPDFDTFVQDGSNPEMPNDIYGFKINLNEDTPVFTFSFLTTHAPVWGDFYAKDGNSIPTRAYNMAFSTGPAGSGNDQGEHLAVPNGVPVPDTGITALLLGQALLLLGLLKSRLSRR